MTVTLPTTPAAGDTLVATIGLNLSTISVTSITGGGGTWAAVVIKAGTGTAAETWAALNVAGGGSTTITINFSASGKGAASVAEFSGIASASAVDATGSVTGGSTTAVSSGSATTTNASDLVVASVGWRTGAAPTTSPGSPWTNFTAQTNSSISEATAWQITSATGTYSAAWTLGASTPGYDGTIAAFKTAPPSIPSGVSITPISSSRLDVAWTASTDNVAVQGYRVYRDSVLVGTVGTNAFSDVGLALGSGHAYTVAAIDGVGNASAQSSAASGTALPATATTTYTYDANGNRLTAADGSQTISSTYDRLNRPLTVAVDTDTGAGTTYTYSLTSPTWTDPTGTYTATLDKFDRQIALLDPIHGAAPMTWSYRADGQVASMAAQNGNTTASTYNTLGRTTSLATTAAGPVTRASYTFTLNAAGQMSADASTITGDPTNGTTTYTYDALARLTAYTRSGTTTAYGWQATPNRSSVQVGAAAATTYTFDDANRVTADSAGGTYTADADGRLTSRPGQRLAWDSLGRLTKVLPPTGAGALATYTYDPLDRLLLADDGTTRTRFRYVGQTTAIAQTVNDQTGVVIVSIGNDWTGEHRLDWTGSGQNVRFYGTNAHHDLVWTADATGAVSATLRYDPWGTLTSSTGTSLPPFRFQGSWADPATNLSWVITRWYAPALGTFISEDSLLGDPADPPSRHLYAYALGNPVLGWDPQGRAPALGTCGGPGCTASANKVTRKAQWRLFFEHFPGFSHICARGFCGSYVKRADTGNGTAMLGFLDWIIRSERFDESRWWRAVDAFEVQGSLTAWREFDLGRKIAGSPVGGTASYLWSKYVWHVVPPGRYFGGTSQEAWDAHQASLWAGVRAAAIYRAGENLNEQLVMYKVLHNVEVYYRLGHPADALLGVATVFGWYPTSHPAPINAACAMLELFGWESYVNYRFAPPSSRDPGYCPDSALMKFARWFSFAGALLLLGCTSGGPADNRDPGCVAFDKQVQFVSWSADGSRAAVLAENGGLADLVTVSWPKLEVASVVSGITIFTDVSGVDAAGAAFWIDNDPSWDARLHLKAPGGADRIIRFAHPRYLGIWLTDAGIFVLTYLPPELSGSTEQTFLSRASLVGDRLVDGDVLVQVDERPMTAWVDPAGIRWVTTEATSETGDIAVRVWVDGSQVAEVPLAGAHDVSLGAKGESIIYTSDLALHEITNLGSGSDTVISRQAWFSASLSAKGVIAGIAPSSSGKIKACFEALGSPEPTSTAVH